MGRRNLAWLAGLALAILVVATWPVVRAGIWAGGEPASATTRAVAQVPGGIPRDCSVDVTARLQRWIDAQPDGDAGDPQVLDLGAGCFRLGSAQAGTRGARGDLGPRNGLLLIGRMHLVLRGSARLVAVGEAAADGGSPIPRALVWIEDSDDVLVTGADVDRDGRVGPVERLRIEGTHRGGRYDPVREHDHGIRILGGHRIRVRNVAIERSWGDGVYVGPSPTRGRAEPAREVEVSDSVIRDSGRHAISCVGCDGLRVRDNRLTDVGYWVIDLEQQLALVPIRDVAITGNEAQGARYGFTAISAVGSAAAGIADVVVRANTFTNSQTCLEFVSINGAEAVGARAPTERITISDNVFHVNQHGILARDVTELTVTGNRGVTRSARSCPLAPGPGLPDRYALLVALPGTAGLTLGDNSFAAAEDDGPRIPTAELVRVTAPRNG
ncbi:MAG: right-handed parallel beta-helix repeat-containing protein [Tetrasphaera sp.]